MKLAKVSSNGPRRAQVLSILLALTLIGTTSAQAQELFWAKQIKSVGVANNDQGYAIAVDGTGNSYVTGLFGGTARFGEGDPNQTDLTSAGSFDIFVAKYDPNGVLVWAKQADADFPRGIAVDSAGNSYVTGNFAGNATFGPGEGNETTLDSGGLFQDIFVAKYNSNGTLAWAKKAGGTSANDFGRAIAADG